MQNFLDAHGQFQFPEHLFPDAGPRALPTVSNRRVQILSDAPTEAQVEMLQTGHNSVVKADARSWARDVLEFDDLWSPMPSEVISRSIKILKILASSDDGEAAYILGNWGCTAQCNAGLISSSERRTYLRDALKRGFHRGWYRVALNSDLRGDIDQALSRFKRGVDRQDSACLFTMALAYMQGRFGLEKNIELGINLANLAIVGADSDFPRAPYLMGKILLGEGGNSSNGLGIDGIDESVLSIDKHRGLELVERSAMLGFAPALMRLADAYLGHERGFDCALALRYLSLAACQDVYRRYKNIPPVLSGKPESQVVKWLLCGYKDVVIKSEEWAYRFAEVAALDQNASALFALAYFSEIGIATNQDIQKAKALYQMSADRGCAPASARLAQLERGLPELRRTLTRQDHNERIKKHSMKLLEGSFDVSEAINDEKDVTFFDRALLPAPATEDAITTPLHSTSQLPYPNRHNPNHSLDFGLQRESKGSPTASHRSIRSVSSLPYPADDINSTRDVNSASNATDLRISPRSNNTRLPYPDSPDINRMADPSLAQNYKLTRNLSPSASMDSSNSTRYPSIGLGDSPQLKPAGTNLIFDSTTIANTSPGSQQATQSSPYANAKELEGSPDTQQDTVIALSSQHLSCSPQKSDSNLRRANVASPNLKFTSIPPESLSPSLQSFPSKLTRDSPINSHKNLVTPMQGGSSQQNLQNSPQLQHSIQSSQAPQQKMSNMDLSQNSPRSVTQRTLATLSTPSLQPSAEQPISSDKLRSRSRSVSPTTSPYLRRLSAHFAGSVSSLFSQSSTPSSDTQSAKSQFRSVSPLGKMFGTSPQKRAEASLADRRVLAEAALAELKNVPKVPVQPIKTVREPGVAYTFKEMGIETVSTDKSNKCSLM